MPNYPVLKSFIFSLILYLGLLACFGLIAFESLAQNYTDDKDSFAQILLVAEQDEQRQTSAKDLEIKAQAEPPQPQPQPEVAPTLPQPTSEPSLKELFSDIKIQSQKPKPKPKQSSNEASKIISSLEIKQSQKSQSKGVYDEILGAIQKRIQQRWQSYKADSNNSAQVSVYIDASGRFSYKILKLSYDDNFNEKVKECLIVLSDEIFPHSDKNITINLTLKDKLD